MTYLRTVERNPWIPLTPHSRQRQFLLFTDVAEVFYGGAAGPGKTVALLMAAAQFVDIPGYSALLLRENFADLNQPESLLPLSKSWWFNRADWSATNHRWTFPSGATITFGYLERDDSVYQYDSAAFQFIGIDELTQHTEWRYRFLFGRIRRPAAGQLSGVPLRMRSASNPGNKGHAWVKGRFIEPATRKPGAVFVPAKLSDNPHIDAGEYRTKNLANLDPLTRAQREDGDWDAVEGGRLQRHWFRNYHWRGDICVLDRPGGKQEFDVRRMRTFITVDPAASVSTKADFTVISSWCVSPWSDLVWLGCDRFKAEVPDIIPRLQTAVQRRRPQVVGIETALSNRAVYQLASRATNPTIPACPMEPGGRDKLVRATQFIVLASQGRVYIPAAAADPSFPREDVLSELVQFTGDDKKDAYDDIVDTGSMATELMDGMPATASGREAIPSVMGGRY
jgi:phage terminase large subunit-like protein